MRKAWKGLILTAFFGSYRSLLALTFRGPSINSSYLPFVIILKLHKQVKSMKELIRTNQEEAD